MKKEDRYNWVRQDERGTLEWINKSDLETDERYQRLSTNTRVIRIAKNWSWAAFGTLSVAQRADGTYYVFDGKHRKAAADKRSDIDLLPCSVHQSKGAKEEAVWFKGTNTDRRPMTVVESFPALLMADDRTAAVVQELIDVAGRTISKNSSSGTVSCLRALMRAVEKNEAAVRRLWPLLVEICDGHPFHYRAVEGLLHLEMAMDGDGSLTKQPYRGKLLALGYSGIVEAAEKAAAYYAKGGAKQYAIGIQDALNYRARTTKLSVVRAD